jgi:dihydrofolate reductase
MGQARPFGSASPDRGANLENLSDSPITQRGIRTLGRVKMRRLIMWNMVTLDGLFEGPKSWDIDWHEYVWGEELEQLSIEQLKSADMLLFGRVTYQGMASHWPSATGEVADFMNSISKVVFSRTLDNADWSNTRLVKANAQDEVAKLKQKPGKDLLIFGSADLSSSLMRNGLIDEYRLGMTPVVLGGGNPLFKPSPERLRMNLLEARPLKSGCVILRYEPLREQ